MTAVVGRVLRLDATGEKGGTEVFAIILFGDVFFIGMVYQALEAWIQTAAYHFIDCGMDGNRPVTAVPVLQAASERPLFQADSVKRHPGQLVYPPSGIAVYQNRVHKRDVLVLPEQRQLLSGEGDTMDVVVLFGDLCILGVVLCHQLELYGIFVHLPEKVPYMLIVGQKEEEAGLVSVRSRFLGDEGQKDLKEFMSDIQKEISSRIIKEEEEKESE